MDSEYPGGSGNFHGQSPWKLAAPGQRIKLGRGNVKSKSQTCPELFWREGFNIDEKKVNQEGGRAMPHEGP